MSNFNTTEHLKASIPFTTQAEVNKAIADEKVDLNILEGTIDSNGQKVPGLKDYEAELTKSANIIRGMESVGKIGEFKNGKPTIAISKLKNTSKNSAIVNSVYDKYLEYMSIKGQIYANKGYDFNTSELDDLYDALASFDDVIRQRQEHGLRYYMEQFQKSTHTISMDKDFKFTFQGDAKRKKTVGAFKDSYERMQKNVLGIRDDQKMNSTDKLRSQGLYGLMVDAWSAGAAGVSATWNAAAGNPQQKNTPFDPTYKAPNDLGSKSKKALGPSTSVVETGKDIMYGLWPDKSVRKLDEATMKLVEKKFSLIEKRFENFQKLAKTKGDMNNADVKERFSKELYNSVLSSALKKNSSGPLSFLSKASINNQTGEVSISADKIKDILTTISKDKNVPMNKGEYQLQKMFTGLSVDKQKEFAAQLSKALTTYNNGLNGTKEDTKKAMEAMERTTNITDNLGHNTLQNLQHWQSTFFGNPRDALLSAGLLLFGAYNYWDWFKKGAALGIAAHLGSKVTTGKGLGEQLDAAAEKMKGKGTEGMTFSEFISYCKKDYSHFSQLVPAEQQDEAAFLSIVANDTKAKRFLEYFSLPTGNPTEKSKIGVGEDTLTVDSEKILLDVKAVNTDVYTVLSDKIKTDKISPKDVLVPQLDNIFDKNADIIQALYPDLVEKHSKAYVVWKYYLPDKYHYDNSLSTKPHVKKETLASKSMKDIFTDECLRFNSGDGSISADKVDLMAAMIARVKRAAVERKTTPPREDSLFLNNIASALKGQQQVKKPKAGEKIANSGKPTAKPTAKPAPKIEVKKKDTTTNKSPVVPNNSQTKIANNAETGKKG